jgi:hypothetical protein
MPVKVISSFSGDQIEDTMLGLCILFLLKIPSASQNGSGKALPIFFNSSAKDSSILQFK